MSIVTDISQIDIQQWEKLIAKSSTATWFQTKEAYDFYAYLPTIFEPFVVAIERSQESRFKSQKSLQGLIVGYVTKEKNPLKQFFTRRAIIIGGPLLANDISHAELTALLNAVQTFQPLNLQTFSPIYIEMRNFNDYSQWRNVFEECRFAYQPHLNFHIDTSSVEIMESNLGKSRKRDIKEAEKNGIRFVINPTKEHIKEYYCLLLNLYKKKIKTPLFPFAFFEQLYHIYPHSFFLIEQDNKIVAGTVCVQDNKTMYEWFACSSEKQSHTYATYCAMYYAAQHGLQRYDMMGAGKPNETYGVRDFKAQFGGKMVEYGRFLHINNKVLYKVGKFGSKILKKQLTI